MAMASRMWCRCVFSLPAIVCAADQTAAFLATTFLRAARLAYRCESPLVCSCRRCCNASCCACAAAGTRGRRAARVHCGRTASAHCSGKRYMDDPWPRPSSLTPNRTLFACGQFTCSPANRPESGRHRSPLVARCQRYRATDQSARCGPRSGSARSAELT
jgi:hypothetical protein